MLRPYNNATGAAPFESLMIADIGDIAINTYNLAATVDIIHKHIATIAGHGCKPLILGGDHTITYPILQGIKVSNRYLACNFSGCPLVSYSWHCVKGHLTPSPPRGLLLTSKIA